MSNKKEYKFKFNFNGVHILGIIFVLFKLLGVTAVANWSWWIVLLPFYFGLALAVSILVGVGLFYCAVGTIANTAEMISDFVKWVKRK